MPLITPEQLVVYLDLPAGTQPTDRAQLVCTVVIEAIRKTVVKAGGSFAEPYADGLFGVALAAAARIYENPLSLRTLTVGSTTSGYAGDVVSILTAAEKDEIGSAVGAGGPRYSFPAARGWPDPVEVPSSASSYVRG